MGGMAIKCFGTSISSILSICMYVHDHEDTLEKRRDFSKATKPASITVRSRVLLSMAGLVFFPHTHNFSVGVTLYVPSSHSLPLCRNRKSLVWNRVPYVFGF